MNKLNRWLIEGIWFIFTAIIVYLIIYPIRREIYQFPFEKSNIYFIVIFITFLRWILLWRYTPFHKWQVFKFILAIAAVWLFLYSSGKFSLFQNFLDEKGIESLTIHLPDARQMKMQTYITSEFIFFAVGTLLTSLMMPFRMLVSIWTTHNHKSSE